MPEALEIIRAADYTNGSARRSPKLTLYIIAGGRRGDATSFDVSGKAQARLIALRHGHTPWNF